MAMLNAHPSIGMLPETFFVLRHICYRAGSREQLVERIASDDYLQRLPFDLADILNRRKQIGPLSPAAVHREIFAEFARIKEVSVVGEKAPKYVELLPVLNALYPASFILHVIRDPRDVLMSRRKAEWSAGYSDYAHVLAYESQLTYGRSVGSSLFGRRYLEVIYEQLISNPTGVLRGIAETLGVEYSDAMLDFGKSGEELLSDSERQWKKETTGPLLANNYGKWKSALSDREVKFIEDTCPTVFNSGLYERSTGNAGGAWLMRSALRAAGFVYKKRVASKNYRTVCAIQQELPAKH